MVNTYNTYKNSGIEWIPYIPQSWKTMRLKNVGFLYGGLTGKTGDDFNVEDDNESYMLFIPFTNIFNNSIINPNQLYKVKVSNDENQNLVQKNDLLFLMSSEDYDGIGKPAILEDSIDNLAYIIHSGFISGYQNRYGDNLKPPTNVYHRMTA